MKNARRKCHTSKETTCQDGQVACSQRPHADSLPSTRELTASHMSQTCGLAMSGPGCRREATWTCLRSLLDTARLYPIGCWTAGSHCRKTKQHREIIQLVGETGGKIHIGRDDRYSQSQENLDVARRSSVGDAFMTGDQVVPNVACSLLCMLWTYFAFCRCEKR